MIQSRSVRTNALKILIAGILIGSSGLLTAQEPTSETEREMTLESAITTAIANSPQIKRALLSVEDADELVRIAYSEIFPDVTSSLNYTRNFEIPVQFVPGEFFGGQPGTLVPVSFGTDNNWQGGFTATQTLFRGETIIGLSTSEIFKTVQKESYRATSQQVITQTRIAYYSVLVAGEQLRLQQAQVRRLQQNLNENRRRQEAGLVDEYDVLRLEVQLSNQKPQLVEAEYALEEAYRNLKLVMGMPNDFEFTVVGDLNEFNILDEEAESSVNRHLKEIDRMNPFAFSSEQVEMDQLEETRGDLRILDARMNLKDREIRAVKSRFLPTLSASYNLQWTAAEPGAPNFFENNARFQTLGLNLSLPLFQGMRRVADVQRVLIDKKDLEEQRRATELNAKNEVASAAEDLNMAFETAGAREIALKQARQGYDRAKKRFENGLGSQIEVTEAEVQVRQAEVNYALMVYNYLTAKAQYDLAVGVVPFVDTELKTDF